jgi:hypothetical protein
MEALTLQIIGGWEQVTAAITWQRFHVAGKDGEPLTEAKKLAKVAREMADEVGVRWPHQHFGAALKHAQDTRSTLAHLLYVECISGERPDRTMRIMRLGKPGEPRQLTRGLEWLDETWSMQTRHRADILERDLISALAAIRSILRALHGLNRIRNILREDTPRNLPAEMVIDPFSWQINWWHPSWGEPGSRPLTVADVFLSSGETNTG